MYVSSPHAETGFFGLIGAAIEDAGKLFGDVASGETGVKAERKAKKAAQVQKDALEKTRQLHAQLAEQYQQGPSWAPPSMETARLPTASSSDGAWLWPLLALGGVVVLARRRQA